MKNKNIFQHFFKDVRKNQRKIISGLLVFCMVFTLLLTNAPYSYATEDTNMAEMDALAALGIDSSVAPEGFDENDTSNPYGKDTVTLNPVEEIQVFGLEFLTSILKPKIAIQETDFDEDGKIIEEKTVEDKIDNYLISRIYGHNDYTNKSTKAIIEAIENEEDWNKRQNYFAEGKEATKASGLYHGIGGDNAGYYLQTENYDITTTFSDAGSVFNGESIAVTKIAKGNFDGNKEGKTAQNVLIYTGKFDQYGGLYMRVGNAVEIDESNPIGYGDSEWILIPTDKAIGNPADKIAGITENFATNPYLMQNYLQVTTGDYDGDGVDEIAVFIPELNGSRIVVYKLKTVTGGADYKEPNDWELAWTYSLSESGYVSNMVSLVSGDFNKDGIDDLGVTWGYYYGPQHNTGSKAVVMFGAKGNMLQKSQEFPLKHGEANIVRGSFIYGDLVGSGEEVLILGGQSAADIANGNLNSRYVATYNWNGTSFVSSIAKNFDLFEKDSHGNYTYPMMADREEFYSSPSNPANLAVIKQGLSEPAYLYLDSLQIQYTDKGLELVAPLDIYVQDNQDNPEYYVEYGATSGDLIGLGYETLVTMSQTLSRIENIGEVPEGAGILESWIHKLLGIVWHFPTENYVPKFIPSKAYIDIIDFKDEYHYKKEVDYSTSVCMQNTDDDTSFLKYTGKHYFTYSDPQVLAVLASPPYFSDLLGRDDLSGNYVESATTYSSTTGTGGGDTTNLTIEAGAYVSFEQEFSVFGVVVASVEAEVAITAGFTYEMEKTSMLEQTVTYRAAAGEDMIAFFSIPLEIYEYSAFMPDGSGGYTEQAMTINIPRLAAVQMINLDAYEDIAKDYDVLPQISGTILDHTVGEPATYPTSQDGYLQSIVYAGDWARVGYSKTDAGITQEIAMTEELTESYNFSAKIDTKAGAGAGGVTLGVTVGVEGGGGWVNISTAGNSFSGELNNMPAEAEAYGYSHAWKIFSYLYDNNGISFPIVSYLVNDVVAPPPLPEDFEQNVEKTTDRQIAFNWTYDGNVAGFQIYRYYEFPEGSGSYELRFVPMTEGVKNSDGVYEFEFIDENLSPYTDYQYQIQTVRASVPNNSIPGEVVTARTKTDSGYPEYRIEGLDNDGILRIYPDSESTVKLIVENAEDYPNGISYQWQKYVNGVWASINGKTSASLTFKSSGTADQAIYRCRTNVIYYDEVRGNNYYITAYSPEFSTLYSKRTPKIVEDSFTASEFDMDSGGGKGLKLDIDLISGNTNHFAAPTGNVTFTVRGSDYNADFTVALESKGTQDDGKAISTATKQVLNLPEGVYEISAYYGGSRVFRSLTTPSNIAVLIGSSGYQMLLQRDEDRTDSFIYGDMITPVLKIYDEENPEGAVVDNNKIEYYYEWLKLNLRPLSIEIVREDIELDNSGSFPTPNVGGYTLKAELDDGTIIERGYTVAQRDITIKAVDKSNVGKGSVLDNPPELELTYGKMAFEETLEGLNLAIVAKNTAGNVIPLDNETDPGNYTIIGMASGATPDSYKNYNVTFVEGIYTIIGQQYDVTMKAEMYQGREVGAISLGAQGTKFSASTELLFFAEPYSGYEVDKWSIVNGEEVSITILPSWLNASKTRLAYTMLNEPIDVTVSFKKAATTLHVATQGEGSIESNPVFTNGTIVANGAEFEFTATPEVGYTFKEWRIESGGSISVRTGNANEDGTNILHFTMGSMDTVLRAVFVRDNYTITLSDNLEAIYLYDDGTGNDIEMVVGSGAKIEGDTEVTVRVKAGYELADGTQWEVNGAVVTVEPSVGYVFDITEDTTIRVDTAQQLYTLSTSSENGSISIKVNDDVPITGGPIDNVAGGSKVVFTATPNHGYAFSAFTVTETETGTEIDAKKYTVRDNILTINELGTDITVEATFTESTDYQITVNYGNRAVVNYILYDSYNNEVGRDTVNSGGAIGVSHGDKITLTVSPDAGYMVDKWTVDGIVDDTSSRTKTLENISDDMVVKIDIISQISYTVNYSVGSGNGSITSATSDGREFESGDTDVGGNSRLVITAAPGSDQMVSHWTFNGQKVLDKGNKEFIGNVLTIEELISSTATVDIQVHFKDYEEIYDITIDRNVDGGEIDAIITTSYEYQALAGEKIILEQEADLDYTFVRWLIDPSVIVTESEGGEFSFIMPADDVTVSAEFKEIDGADVSIEVFDTNFDEPGGHNGTFSVELDREGISGYPNTIKSGVIRSEMTDVKRAYTDNYVSWPATIVYITAEPDDDFRVLKWTVNKTVYTNPLDFPVPSGSMNEFIIDIREDTEDLDIKVQFEQIGSQITYGIDGGEGEIISVINETTGEEFESGNTVTEETNLLFKAEAEEGYEIEAWLVNGEVEQEGDIDTFEYYADGIHGARISVVFGREPFRVKYSGINGEVNSEQVASGGSVRGDTEVTFIATADPGYEFDYFDIKEGATSTTSTSNPLTITIEDNTEVTAYFIPSANIVINYSVKGGNGSLSATKNGMEFGSGEEGAGGDTIVFTATPDENYRVKQWTVDAKTINSDSNTYNLGVSKTSHNVSVEFERSHYSIDFYATGSGTITASSKGSQIIDGSFLLGGSNVVFTAVPDDGYQVKIWKLNGTEVAGSLEELNFSLNNIASDSLVTVEFEPIPTYTINIAITGTGEGTIKAYVNGMEVAIDGSSIIVNNHDEVELNAMPKDIYNNASWTVSGGSYELEDNSVKFLDVISDITATVKFGVAELITVEAYARSEGENPVNGSISVKEGYGDNLKPLNAVNTTVNITKGKTVEFTAVPGEGYMVKQWKLNDQISDDFAERISLVPNSNIKAEVYFEPIEGYKIPISGENYSIAIVEKNPEVAGLGDDLIRKNGTLIFKISPAAGYYLKELEIFEVDCINGVSNQGTNGNIVTAVKNNGEYTITIEKVTEDVEYTVVAVKPVITITTPSNGTITASVSGVAVENGDDIPAGAELTLKAVAGSGYRLSSWGDFASGKSGNEIKLTVPNRDFTVSASFARQGSGGSGGETGGGPSGGTGGDSSGETGDNDSINIDVSGGARSVQTAVTIFGDTATVSAPSDRELQSVIGAAATAGQSVSVDLSSLSDNLDTAVIPNGILTGVADSDAFGLEIIMPDGKSVDFDTAALGALISAGSGDLQIEVSNVSTDSLTAAQKSLVGDAPVIDLTAHIGDTQIHDFGGGLATVSIPVSGEPAEHPIVWCMTTGTDGKVYLEAIECTYNAKTKCYEFRTGTFSEYVIGNYPFTDTFDSAWYYEDVIYAYVNGLFSGTADTTFEPDLAMTRCMLATVLWRMENEPQASAASFTDVGDGMYYARAVAWASANGIVSGYGNGVFGPDDKITREQMAAMMYRYAQYKDYDVSVGEDTNILSYKDVESISEYAIPAIQWACGAGLIQGSDGNLMPRGDSTRAQVAAILHRFNDNVVK